MVITMTTMTKIDVLGTAYTIIEASQDEDKLLEKYDGYCDKSTKRIVVVKTPDSNELGDPEWYKKKCIRHEIIHAFLIESGLQENWTHEDGHDETYVDWIAAQFPKLQKAFEEAGAL